MLPRCWSAIVFCSNLIDNATTYGRQADIHADEDSGHLNIRLHDQGPGVPEDEIARVFEPFYRLDCSRSRFQMPNRGRPP